jgi:hypothetical protein
MPEISYATDALDITAAEMSALLESPTVLEHLKGKDLQPSGIDNILISKEANGQSLYGIELLDRSSDFNVKSHVEVTTGRVIVDSVQFKSGLWIDRDGYPADASKDTIDMSIAKMRALLSSPLVQKKLRQMQKHRPSTEEVVKISCYNKDFKVFLSPSCWIRVSIKSRPGPSGSTVIDTAKPGTKSCN